MASKKLRPSVMKEGYEGQFAGHLSKSDGLRQYVWWKGMKNDITNSCKACVWSVHLGKVPV